MVTKPTNEVIDCLKATSSLHGQTQLLGIILKKEGQNFAIDGHSGEYFNSILSITY